MILKDLLKHFNISVTLPEYLYEESFNDVFMKADLSLDKNSYKLTIKTQKKVTHTMIINEQDSYPVIISSTLPNNTQNGIMFGQTKDDLKYI